jgi:hypothetical protein
MSQVTFCISAVCSEFAEVPSHFPDRVSGPGDYRTYLDRGEEARSYARRAAAIIAALPSEV